jgi:SAM-dependent methyltransferase
MEMNNYQRLRERYEEGQVPWDNELPPPEVLAAVEKLTPGLALDLGCGYGRAAIYLASRHWQVDAVDFIDIALQEAVYRAVQVGVDRNIRFHHAPVTDMPFLVGPYDLVLDVGCMHSFDEAQLHAYRNEVRRLLRPGGRYLLFAHLRNQVAGEDESWRWVAEPLLLSLFTDGFALEKVEHGLTQVADAPPWRSAWFWFRRL